MTDQTSPPPESLEGLDDVAGRLKVEAQVSFTRAGQWLARTFVVDTIEARRASYANAERWAARGLELERQAKKMHGSVEHVSDHG